MTETQVMYAVRMASARPLLAATVSVQRLTVPVSRLATRNTMSWLVLTASKSTVERVVGIGVGRATAGGGRRRGAGEER